MMSRGESTHGIRRVGSLDSAAVEQEADGAGRLALPLAEGIHQLLELRGALDLEEDLVVVVRHLDVEVLGLLRLFGLAWGAGGAVLVGSGHGGLGGCVCVGVVGAGGGC